MKRYLIGKLVTDIETDCERLIRCGKKYLYDKDGTADITVEINDDMMNELYNKYDYLSHEEVAYMATGSVFYHKVLRFNSLMLHASAIAVDGRGYCFSAPSGTGKSTHTGLWQKYLGEDKVKYINDDKPLIMQKDKDFFVCGTPWSGKTDLNNNICVPLKAIVFIKRGTECSIKRIEPQKAVTEFYEQTVKPKKAELMSLMLATADKLLMTVPIYELICNMSEDAVKVCNAELSEIN